PSAAPVTGAHAEGAGSPAMEPLHGAYVLVIEDDASMRDALGRMLDHWEVLVESAATGEEALQIAAEAERSFDAIVSDFCFPGAWDGLRLIDELRRLVGARAPAIPLSVEFSVSIIQSCALYVVLLIALPPDLAVLI